MWSYLVRVGKALDEFLNVAMFGGEVGMTISEHSARANQAGKRWGCIMCWLLSRLVERGHCSRVLIGATTGHGAAMRAFTLLMLSVLAAWWLFSSLAGLIAGLI